MAWHKGFTLNNWNAEEPLFFRTSPPSIPYLTHHNAWSNVKLNANLHVYFQHLCSSLPNFEKFYVEASFNSFLCRLVDFHLIWARLNNFSTIFLKSFWFKKPKSLAEKHIWNAVYVKILLAFWDKNFLKIRNLNYVRVSNLNENLSDGEKNSESCVHETIFKIGDVWAKLLKIYV